LITGALKPDKGTIDKGDTTVMGYFHQSGIVFKGTERVIDVVTDVAEYITMADGKTITASNLLTQFLFPPAKQYGLVSKLSGGEKKRLQLMNILMKNPNFLILDEPTNDLDIDTLNILEEFLMSYPGVLIVVTHDRYLLDKLTDQLFILEGNGKVLIYNGNYSSYRIDAEEAKAEAKRAAKNPAPKQVEQTAPKKSKLAFKEQQEMLGLEKDIAHLEQEIKSFTVQLNSGITNHEELAYLADKIQDMNDKLEEKTFRWLELTELNEA
jgi:ATP-binding cassette subfamily F protein uup